MPDPERFKCGLRIRIRGGTFDGKYGDVIYDNGALVTVNITDHGCFELGRDLIVPASREFVTDNDIARRLGQLEYRLLTAQAELPAMIRELHNLRHALEK